MAHGPRGGRVRAAFTGLGLALCVWASAGSIGCTNPDKPAPKPAQKFDANGRPIPPGLTGTSTIPGPPGSGGVGLNRTGQQGVSPAAGMGSGTGGIQQVGGTGIQTTGNMAPYNPNGTGGMGLYNGYQPPPAAGGYQPSPGAGGFGGSSSVVPSAGPGGAPGSYRPGAGSISGSGPGTAGFGQTPPPLVDPGFAPGLAPPAPPAGTGGSSYMPISPSQTPPPGHGGSPFGAGN
jgi:hypothetical protein